MGTYKPNMPQIDGTVPRGELHERCEQVAVPCFDWFNEPIIAVIDGFLHVEPAAAPHAGRRPDAGAKPAA